MTDFKVKGLLLTATLFMLIGCSNPLEGKRISEEIMQKYLVALHNIKTSHPGLMKKLGTLQLRESSSTEEIEQSAVQAGFDDGAEFLAVNGKILSLYHAIRSRQEYDARLETIRSLHKQDQERLEAILENPAVSDKVKSEIQWQKERMDDAHNRTVEHLKENHDEETFTEADGASVALVEQHMVELRKILHEPEENGDPGAIKKLEAEFRESLSGGNTAMPPQLNGEVTVHVPRAEDGASAP